MSRPFVVESPEIVHKRQAEHVLVGGDAEVQDLGHYTSLATKMFWATEAEVNAKIIEMQDSGWVLDGEPSMTPIYPPLDLYNMETTAHRHTAIT